MGSTAHCCAVGERPIGVGANNSLQREYQLLLIRPTWALSQPIRPRAMAGQAFYLWILFMRCLRSPRVASPPASFLTTDVRVLYG